MALTNDVWNTLFARCPHHVRRDKTLAAVLGDWSTTDRVAVTIPDHTRPISSRVVLDELQRRLFNISDVVVGLGLHRPMSPQEIRQVIGTTHNVSQHNPDDCVEIDRVDGVSIGISKRLMDADWCLTVGTIEVHQYAGVSGGYKGVVIGCGSRESITRLHQKEMVCHPDVQVGRIFPNPFRSEIERIGQRSNCHLALAYVPSLDEWWFGRPSDLMRVAEEFVQPWVMGSKLYSHVVLSLPSSKAMSLYQASRAATYLALSPNPPVRQNGQIVLVGKMVEGIGAEQGFVDALAQFPPPWTAALAVDVKGAGAQRIWMLARLATHFRLAVYGVDNPSIFQQVGIEVLKDLPTEDVLTVEKPFQKIPQIMT